MNCPVCSVALTMTDRQGVEIDYCPKCRGVWLDRGELDKIIERSAGSSERSSDSRDLRDSRDSRYEERSQFKQHDDDRYKKHDDDRYKKHDDYGYGHKKKKKESFLSDLFDF